MEMKLRPYQIDAVQAVHNEWDNEGHNKTLLVLPTGAGKTICFSKITQDQVGKGEKILQLAHREELLTQAKDKLYNSTGIIGDIEKAEKTTVGKNSSVVIASVQTMSRTSRLEKFDPNEFQTIIVDEAHHALSESYQTVLKYFNTAKVLGVTATPDRGDKRNLAEYFESTAYEYKMSQAVKDGYLCPIRAKMIPLQIDMSGVKTTAGDYNANDIGNALEPYLEAIADELIQYQDRKTVVFLPLIKISQEFCEMLNTRGFRAAEVNGNSSDREEVLKDFEDGKYNILCNSMLLTEGWDCPSVNCIVCLRPTKIRSLYQQIVGRGSRLYPGKDHLLLLDFLWLTKKHDLCKPSALVAKTEEIANKIDKAIEEGKDIDLIEQEEKSEKDVLEEHKQALAKQLAEQRMKRAKFVDPLQYAISIEDDDLADYEPTHTWELAPPSDKQIKTLEKFGINASTIESKGYASMLLDKLLKRIKANYSTPKQIRLLERYGFDDVGTWDFDTASKCITIISNNKWVCPKYLLEKWKIWKMKREVTQ